ncbi:zinc finger protein 34-like [Episyrphus balteatus]|uniref:zinc finger protein 34-like n=1 Tax=Episyrphus balteatus TaxID=286459 RepID=UPI002484F99D|nr:zinc finger protein 34-like [Episyrphus balteatus]
MVHQIFVLQWPENQVLQLIALYREQECLWNNVDSLQTAIQELHEFLDDVDKEQQQKTTSNSYNEKIYKSLHFLKNVSKSNSNQIAETKSTCDIFNSSSSETEDFNVEDMNDINMCPTEPSLLACHICRVTFENAKDLENHLNDLSSNSQKKICHICGAEFTDRSNFITHLRRHKKEKPFGCIDCSKCFVTSTELKTHIRVHSNEKAFMFMCETCGLQFRYQNHLETHKKLHGEPLLECSVCNKKFLLKRQLAYHQRKHGFEEKAKCLICNNIYRNKDSLLRHERKIHNIRKRKSKQ